MRRILLGTLGGLGIAASVQAMASPSNVTYLCELAASPKELGHALCARSDAAQSMNFQRMIASPNNGLVTPGIREALSQMPEPEGGQAPTLIEVNTNADGNVTECSVVKGSGSDRLDSAACDFAKTQWSRLKPN